ncbi:MAG: hypothetical protein A2X51_13365 [Candidatus Rokubacteria bacterium GWC2_70_24]|nr:MAG: hypothetical protein A2X51_13365 [Candidatus Rokubacteria bacterium GWC2_70_24]
MARRRPRRVGVLATFVALALLPAPASAQMGTGMGPSMGGSIGPRGPANPEPRREAPPAPPAARPEAVASPRAQMAESMAHPAVPVPFYLESTFLLLVGAATAGGGFITYRLARARWRRQTVRAAVVTEAVLVVDLVQSTHLATHYGDGLAMRARTVVRDRALAVAAGHGLTYTESTGDGCFMTFVSVAGAIETALALLRDLAARSADLAPAPPPRVRAAITYGEILLDGRGARHGAVINKAFRLEGVTPAAFVQVGGAANEVEIPEDDRIFLDEAAAEEARARGIGLDSVGFCALKGFAGLHGVYRVTA